MKSLRTPTGFGLCLFFLLSILFQCSFISANGDHHHHHRDRRRDHRRNRRFHFIDRDYRLVRPIPIPVPFPIPGVPEPFPPPPPFNGPPPPPFPSSIQSASICPQSVPVCPQSAPVCPQSAPVCPQSAPPPPSCPCGSLFSQSAPPPPPPSGCSCGSFSSQSNAPSSFPTSASPPPPPPSSFSPQANGDPPPTGGFDQNDGTGARSNATQKTAVNILSIPSNLITHPNHGSEFKKGPQLIQSLPFDIQEPSFSPPSFIPSSSQTSPSSEFRGTPITLTI